MKNNNEKPLYLVYIHDAGIDFEDVRTYEFIFSESKENIDGVGWDSYPAMGHPNPPNRELISTVSKIETDLTLILVQNNEQFSMWDALDGLVALAWEDIEGYDEYPDDRLVFHFGMTYEQVYKLLYSRDIAMETKVKIEH